MRWSRYRRRSTWPAPPSQTCGAGFAAGTVGCEGARIGACPGCCREIVRLWFSRITRRSTSNVRHRQQIERIRRARSLSSMLGLPAERAAVLLAKRGSPHAGYEPLDTAVQHGRLHPATKGRLQQLVIIQGLNLGVAEFGEPRRHRAVKLLQRSACTAPPLSWNQGGPSCFRLCAAFLPKTVRSRLANLCSRFSTSGKMRRP
jgi:hypothetical protein